MHEDSAIETRVIHAGQHPDPISGAVMTPISLATTYAQDGPGRHKGYEYTRTDNPTRRTLEHCLAALEGAEHGIAFASGCAAMTTFFHTLRPGDHIVACDDVYGGTFRILDKVMKPLGIEVSWVDLSDAGNFEAACTDKTRWVWVETPTNPMLKLVDIETVCTRAKARGIRVAVDNTFASPYLQQPLSLGADLVMHSTTKYINGHSDVLGGFLATSDDELNEQLRFLQNAVGAVPAPFDCFMTLRGVKTLAVRIDRHVDNAEHLASWLSEQSQVSKVYYPGLGSHPQATLAKKQMRRPGGMISFVLADGFEAADKFLRAVKLFACAESLGGVESLIEHPAIMTHGSVPKEIRDALGIVDGLIRISVGIESVVDLQNDLQQALNAAR